MTTMSSVKNQSSWLSFDEISFVACSSYCSQHLQEFEAWIVILFLKVSVSRSIYTSKSFATKLTSNIYDLTNDRHENRCWLISRRLSSLSHFFFQRLSLCFFWPNFRAFAVAALSLVLLSRLCCLSHCWRVSKLCHFSIHFHVKLCLGFKKTWRIS